jgi:hypothetical protein
MSRYRHNRKFRGVRWTSNEISKLISLFQNGKSIGEIASQLNRNIDAVDYKLIECELLGFPNDFHGKRTGQTWDEREKQQIIKEFKSGKSIEEMAKIHERRKNAILIKIIGYGLIDIADRSILQKYSDNNIKLPTTISSMSSSINGWRELPTQKETSTFWESVFKAGNAKYWKDHLQNELNKRWGIFDTNLSGLTSEWEEFKRTHMEIAEVNNNVETYKREWEESLTSLGNLLNKNTDHEQIMWEQTQKSKQVKEMKVTQKFQESDVDEIRFNNMMDHIEKYPELQTQKTIEELIESVKYKRNEVIEVEKLYREKIKNVNVFINTVKSKLEKIDHQLIAFESFRKDAEKKIEEVQQRLLTRIQKIFMTDEQKENLRLFIFEFERKIEEGRNQLNLMNEDFKKYEKQEFQPIRVSQFSDIE